MSIGQIVVAGNISSSKYVGDSISTSSTGSYTSDNLGNILTGNTVLVTPNTRFGTQPFTYSYQWRANSSDVVGQTSNSFYLDRTYLGQSISVSITINNPVRSIIEEQIISVTLRGNPINTVLPVITGTLVPGNTLTVSTGTWSGSPTNYTFTYQWYNSVVGAINGATSSSYTLTDSDGSSSVYCIVTASNTVNPNGTGQSSSVNIAPPPPTYAFGSIPASINEGASGTFNVNTTWVNDGTTLYWTILNSSTANDDFDAVNGSFSISGNTGSFTISAVADFTTEGNQTFTVEIRTDSISGNVVVTSTSVTISDTSTTPTVTGQAMFAYAGGGAGLTNSNVTNLISNLGVLNGDVFYSGVSARNYAVGARYGINRAIFGFGNMSSTYYSSMNLVSNTGVMAADSSTVNNPTASAGKAGTYYDTNKGIFGFGSSATTRLSTINLVSNTGVVAGDTATAGTARFALAAASYGTDKAMFGFGSAASTYYSTITLFSNTASMTSNTSSSGTTRDALAACTYGGDKSIFGFGYRSTSPFNQNILTRFSNTGAYVSQAAATSYRGGCNGADYGGDKGIFGYGGSGSGTVTALTTVNKIDNVGNVAAATTGAGSGRQYGASASF